MRLNKWRFAIISSLVFISFSFAYSQGKNQITYIANEGVFIEQNGKKVMIDALHKKYSPLYQHTRPPYPNNIIRGNAPFDSIDLFLVTHVHGDHFDPGMMINFLQNNHSSILIASQQVIDTMGQIQHLESQIYRVGGQDIGLKYQMDGINITTIPLLHSYQKRNFWVENMAYLLDFEGLKILHIGDAELLPENLNQIKKVAGTVDYAILPDWFYAKEAIQQVAQNIKAKKYIGVHIAREESGLYESRLKKRAKALGMDLNAFLRIGEIQSIE